MNKKIIGGLLFLCLSCFANAQTIVDTLPHNRKAVIEQFNGCGYCPDAHRVADSICNVHPDNVFDIRYFQGSFAQQNLPHFITQWGDALAQNGGYYLNAYPSGTINRHRWANTAQYSVASDNYYLHRPRWGGYVDSVLQTSSPVNIAASATIIDSTRTLIIYIELYYTGSSNLSTNQLNVVLLQNNIIDSNISFRQFNPAMEVNDSKYRYMHVVRDMLTGQWGDVINLASEGPFITRTYTYQVPDSIGSIPIPSLCDLEIVAFVAENHREILTGCRAIPTTIDTNIDNINLYVNDTLGGYITKQHCLLTGEIVVTACPNFGYSFEMWSDGVIENPRIIIPGQDTSLTAIFIQKTFEIFVSSADTSLGTVMGGGLFHYGDTTFLYAIPNSIHKHFTHWNSWINDTINPLMIVVTGNGNYIAHFEANKYHVTATPNNNIYGITGGSNIYDAETICTLSAMAYNGYRFLKWSNNETSNPYSFIVTQDSALTAIFVSEDSIFNIVATCDPTMGTVTGGGFYLYGDSVMLTATPNPTFIFDHWHDGDTNNPRYVIATSDATYIAYFTQNAAIEDATINNMVIYVENGRIVVNGQTEPVRVFDIMGREVKNESLPTGSYMVKIGNYPARKVVVIK